MEMMCLSGAERKMSFYMFNIPLFIVESLQNILCCIKKAATWKTKGSLFIKAAAGKY